ncbi:hypothetical protein ASE01_19290 [Nocardioides sp. Root190]|uniref:signal peptidase I n=1 Tax=Nocardioides sp. Root190 TaxID=1736488 RepID=UPI0006F7E50B|nr:signal peptidase I [Nocardioides sp. Root190]KRB74129.1 hypothetical protein ASE01_19290 [Nocardioides sp. Root190]
MTKTLRFGREAVLWTGGVLGSLCLLSLLAGWLFNVTPLVFASGSMSPSYEAGALGVAREVPAADLRVGDVVSVVNAEGNRVTHRIVEIAPGGDSAVLTLQGDTNKVPDDQAYAVTSVDRVAFGVPYAGYALNAAASPFGLLAGGLLVLSALWLGYGRRDDDDAAGSARARVLVPTGVAGVVLTGTLLGATGQAPWAFTSAFWTDTATATTTASTPAPPAVIWTGPVNCAQATPNINISWINTNASYEYFWQVQEINGTPTVGEPNQPSGTTGAAVAQGGTVSVSIAPGGSGNRTWQVAVYAQLEGQAATRTLPVIRAIWRIQPGGNRMSCTAP